MIKFATDEDFKNLIECGVLRRQLALDIAQVKMS